MAGFNFRHEEEFRRTEKVTNAYERSPRNSVDSVRQPVVGGDTPNNPDGVVNEDWDPFEVVKVQIWNVDGYTGRLVDARAPGTDGTDKAGTRCQLVRMKGYPTFKYQIHPLECEPTGTPVTP